MCSILHCIITITIGLQDCLKSGRMLLNKIEIVHIGLHKTGSSFLQKHIFSKMENVYSHEGLSGAAVVLLDAYCDRELLANGIKGKYGDVKIILVLRDKEDWLRSCYAQSIKNSNKFFHSFDFWSKHIFKKELLDFDSYVELLNSLFSEVLVLQYEELRDSPETFIQKIFDFTGQEVEWENEIVNKRHSEIKVQMMRMINLIKQFVVRKI